MPTEIPEPPDGSVVGWGHPVDYVRVRIDEYAGDWTDTANAEERRRWFRADSDSGEPPVSWADLMRSEHLAAPYLLVRQEVDRG